MLTTAFCSFQTSELYRIHRPASLLVTRHLSLVSSLVLAFMWPQPLAPAHNLGISALIATLPLAVVLVLMGGLRKSGALSAALGLATAFLLAILVWGMPLPLGGFERAVWVCLCRLADSLDRLCRAVALQPFRRHWQF